MSKFDSIDFKIINDKQLLQLFSELSETHKKSIVNNGIKKAAKPIIDAAKNNFSARKKNKSKTNYSDVNSSFKIEPIKNKETVGVKVGVKYVDKNGRKNWYKYRWIEWGTDERFTRMKDSRGKIQPTHFFYDAVTAHKDEAQKQISDSVTEQIEKTIKKYEKK